MNRRSFLKAASFYGGSIVAGLTLNPFGFLQKTAKAEAVSATKKYWWCYCDDFELKKIFLEMRPMRESLRKMRRINPDDDMVIVIPGGIDAVEKQLRIQNRFYFRDLAALGIENIIVRGMPVISYSDAKRLHRLKMLGKRIYAT